MNQAEFEDNLNTIMFNEGYMTKKGRLIKESVKHQRQAINALAKALGLQKLTLERVEELGFG